MSHRPKSWPRLVILTGFFVAMVACVASPPEPMTQRPAVFSDLQRVQSRLHRQYAQWRGTRYQLGGLSKKGIDCSGFVHLTFRDRLGIALPRTTEAQAQAGRSVGRDALQIGDLVFFKPGLFTRHVGIYLGNSQFLHASTSKGVTISSLQNSYWQATYWKARRL